MACNDDEDYYELRDQVWSYDEDWGEDIDKVRNFLKKVWIKNNPDCIPVETNQPNVQREKDQILLWWWRKMYSDDLEMKYTPIFFKFLKGEYDNSIKFHSDNTGVGPRKKKETFNPAITVNYDD